MLFRSCRYLASHRLYKDLAFELSKYKSLSYPNPMRVYHCRAKLAEAMGRLGRISAAYKNSIVQNSKDNKENDHEIPDTARFGRWLAESISKRQS